MKLSAFLKDKSLLLLLHTACMFVLAGFLHITGYAAANITLICILWFLVLSAWLFTTYLQRKKYFEEAAQILENMDKRYLLGEMLPDSFSLEDKLYREMLHQSNKSVIEKIHALENAGRDYREYLESWVHEIKAPITGISLLCENGRKADIFETLRTISLENRKIENYVDQVLYYARSEQVYKDYLIQETDLQAIVCEVLEKERVLLIQNHIQADVSCDDKVYTDKKWIAFIVNQLILNSVKYCGSTPLLRFTTHHNKNSVILTVKDNGTGILPEDLPRIFEKGFTGSNGRNHRNSTGMGLYLCKKLCDQLGILLSAQSEYGKETKISLTFSVNNYIITPGSD
ncbi:MAG: HAMP domain-containing histidine kinase [Lachnospiraceae bacterium]|nr:HAMP domain-containing histidine kinase [Lachnospiraceae bacterium]